MSDPALDFLHALWSVGYHSLCKQRRPGPFEVDSFHEHPETLHAQALKLSRQGYDVWFGVHAMPEQPRPGQRGRSEHVHEVVALQADLDWADAAHEDTELPTQAEVRQRLAAFGVPPSITVHSGHGLQCYWLLPEPVPASEGLAFTKGLHESLRKPSLKVDRHDLASVLRVPGTINYKREPVEVVIEHADYARRYDPKVLAALVAPPEPVVLSTGIALPDLRPSIGDDDLTPIEYILDNYDIGTELFARGWHSPVPNSYNGWPTLFLTRPGKDPANGHSARLFPGEGVLVFSKAADPLKDRYYDVADVIAAYDYGGDKAAMASDFRRRMMPKSPKPSQRSPQARQSDEPEPLDPSMFLPDEFWQARPWLAQTRQAAFARFRSPDAVLGPVMTRRILHVHPSIVLPPIAGGVGSLNLFVALVARSGGGKSSTNAVARDLYPIAITSDPRRSIAAVDLSVGSGEGIAEVLWDVVPVESEDGKPRTERKRTHDAVHLYVDEGETVVRLIERSGSTLGAEVRAAFSGMPIGQANASGDKFRAIDAHQYRVGMVVAFQYPNAATMLSDADKGTPQRFLWATVTNPYIPRQAPEWSGALRLPSPPSIITGEFRHVEFPLAAQRQIEDIEHGIATGQRMPDPLDSQRTVMRMKLATTLALCDGSEPIVLTEHWEMAEMWLAVSDRVRAGITEYSTERMRADVERKQANAVAFDDARDEGAERREAAKHARRVIDGARLLAAKVRDGKVADRSDLSREMRRHRNVRDDVIQHAEDERWIEVEYSTADNGQRVTKFKPGPVTPR